MQIDKVRGYSSQFIYKYVMNMKLLAVVTPPYIYKLPLPW